MRAIYQGVLALTLEKLEVSRLYVTRYDLPALSLCAIKLKTATEPINKTAL